MIDWSVLGRKRGLPLLTWATAHDELNPSQNRLEEAFIARLLRNLPDAIRPPLLADRGFGRASLLRWLQEMPRHTGQTVDYVVRLKGNVRIQTPDGLSGIAAELSLASKSLYASAWGAVSFRWGGGSQLGIVLGSGASGNPGIWQHRCPMPRWRCGIIASECSQSSTFAMASSISPWIGERQPLRRGWGVCWWGCY